MWDFELSFFCVYVLSTIPDKSLGVKKIQRQMDSGFEGPHCMSVGRLPPGLPTYHLFS